MNLAQFGSRIINMDNLLYAVSEKDGSLRLVFGNDCEVTLGTEGSKRALVWLESRLVKEQGPE